MGLNYLLVVFGLIVFGCVYVCVCICIYNLAFPAILNQSAFLLVGSGV